MSLVVKCSDGQVIQVDKEIITKFSIGFQKKLAENESETTPILIDNVNSRSLLKVVEYCTVHNDPSISAADLKSWDNKFVKVEPSVLCELASAAYHLEIKPMVDLTCYAIAQLLKGNTPEEIRRIFNIIYDFGPDDDVPPPTIRDKLRNRWIRKTNGKRSSAPTNPDFTNPLVHALAIQNAPPPSSSSSSSPSISPLPLLPAATSTPLPDPSQITSEDNASDSGPLSPTTPHTISDTRSVEELLSFINNDGQKPKQKSKKGKRKKKKGDSTQNSSSSVTTATTHATNNGTHATYAEDEEQREKRDKTVQPSKDNDKKQRSRKNNATSKQNQNSKNNNNNNNHKNNNKNKKKSLREKLSDSSLSGSEDSEDVTNENQDQTVPEGEEYEEDGEIEVEEGEGEGEVEEGEVEGEAEGEGEGELEGEEEEEGEEGEEELELDEGEEGEEGDDVDREVEEFRRRLEAAKDSTGPRMALPSALSIALSVLGPKK